MAGSDPLVSVALLTFNGERFLEEILERIFAQATEFEVEVLAIDSGSTDRTLEILGRFPVKLHEIPNEEFNHGETRNLAVSLAKGRFVAFLTQSATPCDERWLQHLVDAFSIDEKVAAVYGRHEPRPGCDPITRRDIVEFFKMMGPDDGPTVQLIGPGPDGRRKFEADKGITGFYSDANSCLRRSAWEQVPYQPLNYAEDQAFGCDVMKAGYWKVYEPRAAVLHSHSYPPLTYFRRQFDEYCGLGESIGFRQQGSIFRVLLGGARGGASDTRYIIRQDYSALATVKWVGAAFLMNTLRRLAGYLAARREKLPESLTRRLSLEAGARERARERKSGA